MKHFLALTTTMTLSTAAAFSPAAASTTTSRSSTSSLALRPDGPFSGGYYRDEREYYGGDDYFIPGELEEQEGVHLHSEGGRPMHASVQEWRNSGHTPFRVNAYSDDAGARRLRVFSPSRDGSPHTMAIRNTGPMEFPITDSSTYNGGYETKIQGNSLRTYSNLHHSSPSAWPTRVGEIIQGEGCIKTFPVSGEIEEVRVFLTSDEGYDIQAKIEVLQGPNNVKQEFDVHSENGREKPFLAIIDTPGSQGHTIRIENTGPMTYPIRADVQPVRVRNPVDDRMRGGVESRGSSYPDVRGLNYPERGPMGRSSPRSLGAGSERGAPIPNPQWSTSSASADRANYRNGPNW